MSTYFERFLAGCFRINFQVFLNTVLERIACRNLNLKKQVRTTSLRTARSFFKKNLLKRREENLKQNKTTKTAKQEYLGKTMWLKNRADSNAFNNLFAEL